MESLFDTWCTYAKIVANDYMHHRHFFEALARELSVRAEEPLRIVDLGCGDCVAVESLCRRFAVSRYIGIDQSETALSKAGKIFATSDIAFSLRCAGMLEALQTLDAGFNVVIASFALHHLTRADKQAVLAECRRILDDDGLMAIVDVFRDEDESRGAYFDRWEANARRCYTALSVEEVDEVLGHVRSSDFPESVPIYCRLAAAAGFKSVGVLARDAERLNAAITLSGKRLPDG